jgi:hypothetical protein
MSMIVFSASQTRKGFDQKKYEENLERVFPHLKESSGTIKQFGIPDTGAHYLAVRKASDRLAELKEVFLGECELVSEHTEYGRYEMFGIFCKDGRKYQGEGIEGLVSAIEEDYCAKVPRIERMIREKNLKPKIIA